MPRTVLTAALLTLVPLSACGGGGTAADPAGGPTDSVVTDAPPAWNPCSGIDMADVAQRFGATYTTRLGTPAAPTCTFAPQTDGAALVDVNYQTYPGSLTELLATFGATEVPGRTRVSTVRVRGADDARLITDVSDDTFVVTGFVRTGLLVQIVNVLDPAPYDRAQLLRGTQAVMADVAANSGTSGLSD